MRRMRSTSSRARRRRMPAWSLSTALVTTIVFCELEVDSIRLCRHASAAVTIAGALHLHSWRSRSTPPAPAITSHTPPMSSHMFWSVPHA